MSVKGCTKNRQKLNEGKIKGEYDNSVGIKFINKSDALDVLSVLSLKSYKCLRISQGIETPEAKRTSSTSVRKHSPKFETVSWDKENVIESLRQWPVGKIINCYV